MPAIFENSMLLFAVKRDLFPAVLNILFLTKANMKVLYIEKPRKSTEKIEKSIEKTIFTLFKFEDRLVSINKIARPGSLNYALSLPLCDFGWRKAYGRF